MSGKHVSAAIKCGLFKGHTYAALLILCHKASTGTAFKSGKVIPEGEIPRFTDKQFMKALRIPIRRESLRQIRKKLVKSGIVVATRVPNNFKGRNTFPVYSYYVSLERLLELGPKPKKSRGKTVAEQVAPSPKNDVPRKVLRTDTQKTLHTNGLYAAKSAAQLGNPTDYSVGAASAQTPIAEDSAVGGECAAGGSSSLRSAAQRDAASGEDASTPTDKDEDKYKTIRKLLDEADWESDDKACENILSESKKYQAYLSQAGYGFGSEKDLFRIWNVLSNKAEWFESDFGEGWNTTLFTEYLPKCKWLMQKTEGNVKWLADRFESKDDRGLLNQFRHFLAGRKRHSAAGGGREKIERHEYVRSNAPNKCGVCGKSPWSSEHSEVYKPLPEHMQEEIEVGPEPDLSWLTDKIGMDEPDTPSESTETIDECVARTKPFTIYNGGEVAAVTNLYKKHTPQLQKYTNQQLWLYSNGKKWVTSASRDALATQCAAEFEAQPKAPSKGKFMAALEALEEG